MARRKGKSARRKNRVIAARTANTSGYLMDIIVDLGPTDSGARDHCPLCAVTGVGRGPFGRARATGQAAVSLVPLDTV